MKIEQATSSDIEAIITADGEISEDMLERKIRDGEIILAKEKGKILAILRYSLFWDSIPFLNLIKVESENRRKGLGSALLLHWEESMKENGHELLMSSTQSDEDGQFFFDRLGYRKTGSFVFPGQEDEIILLKTNKQNMPNQALQATSASARRLS